MEGMKKRKRIVIVGSLMAALVVSAVGCGGASDEQIQREREDAAELARQAEQIRQLKEEAKRSGEAATRTVTVPSEVSPTTVPPTPSSPTRSDPRIPESGTYRGYVSQRGARGDTAKDYEMSMTFSSQGSYVSYPSLGCNGTLRPTGFSGDARVYREVITEGHCDRGGTWKVTAAGRSIDAVWELATTDYVVAGTLTR